MKKPSLISDISMPLRATTRIPSSGNSAPKSGSVQRRTREYLNKKFQQADAKQAAEWVREQHQVSPIDTRRELDAAIDSSSAHSSSTKMRDSPSRNVRMNAGRLQTKTTNFHLIITMK